MIKKLTIKNLLIPKSYPAKRKLATVKGVFFPKFDLSCPGKPTFLPRGKRLLMKHLPSYITNMHPGSLLKNWLHGWRSKTIADFKEITALLNNKVLGLANSYYEWMEKFIEMDETAGYSYLIPVVDNSRGVAFHGFFNNYAAIFEHKFGYPVADARNTFARNVEKMLLGFHSLFASKPDDSAPVLEIINPGANKAGTQQTEVRTRNEETSKRSFAFSYYFKLATFASRSVAKGLPSGLSSNSTNKPRVFEVCRLRNILRATGNLLPERIFRPLPRQLLKPVLVNWNSPAKVGSGFN